MDHALHLGQSKTHMTNMTLFTLQSYSTFKLLNKTCTLSLSLSLSQKWGGLLTSRRAHHLLSTGGGFMWDYTTGTVTVSCVSVSMYCLRICSVRFHLYLPFWSNFSKYEWLWLRVTGWNPLVKTGAPEGVLYVFTRIFGQPNSYQFLMKFGYCRLVKASSWNCIQLQASEPRAVSKSGDFEVRLHSPFHGWAWLQS